MPRTRPICRGVSRLELLLSEVATTTRRGGYRQLGKNQEFSRYFSTERMRCEGASRIGGAAQVVRLIFRVCLLAFEFGGFMSFKSSGNNSSGPGHVREWRGANSRGTLLEECGQEALQRAPTFVIRAPLFPWRTRLHTHACNWVSV